MQKSMLRIHYCRLLRDYEGWGLHVWGDSDEYVTWAEPLKPAGYDDFGIYWDVRLKPGARTVAYVLHKGNYKDPGPDQVLALDDVGREVWLVQGTARPFHTPQQAISELKTASLAEFRNHARAFWLDKFTIGWPMAFGAQTHYSLHYHHTGGLSLTPEGVAGGESIPLEFGGTRLNPELAGRFPHLAGAAMLRIPLRYEHLIPEILKGQVGISARSGKGAMLAGTALQLHGVLDAIYSYYGPLGVTFRGRIPSLRVWAPTAKEVRLQLFSNPSPQSPPEQDLPMRWDPDSGVWWIQGDPTWDRMYYRYAVEVFDRREGSVVRNLVTDPYSTSLARNSARSQVVNLSDPDLMPDGWQDLKKPDLLNPADIVLYELHVRDFSSMDLSVPGEHRGGYLAFTYPESAGMKHLRRLANAGVTHVHLLPLNDFGSVDEAKSHWVWPDIAELMGLPADSDRQQAILQAARGRDGYNWGYDPLHYLAPEGSYASDPDGPARIRELRSLVQALSRLGLRVVQDVVFNHTYAAGRQDKSILDRVVPEYYHRRDTEGQTVMSSCCPDTASENAMMSKLMVDAVVLWAREYKIDGFRFDLMGHHLVKNMETIRKALDSLTPEDHGIDGKGIYLYGEGWDFGELAGNARGPNATPGNLAGTGIGTFNDRFRDAARGGGPFQGLQDQGVITGLYLDPNETSQGRREDQRLQLLFLKDLIRLGLAGNLADFRLLNGIGELVTGADLQYRGAPAAYHKSPQEHVPYLEAHDNETLFDAIQYKAPINTPMDGRVRMQNLGISLLALSQGVPFFHAGMEILRSKSLDRDSYDSGDWFNGLDFTYQANNWGKGLPFFDKNGGNWTVMARLLGRRNLKPRPEHILAVLAHFEEMLSIRRSSPLFSMRAAEEIRANLRFHNTGQSQDPALIVMSLQDRAKGAVGPREAIIVLFNFGIEDAEFVLEDLDYPGFRLHPVLGVSADPIVRTANYRPEGRVFTVPPRTTAVFTAPARPG